MIPINVNKSLVSAENQCGPVYHAFLIVCQEKHNTACFWPWCADCSQTHFSPCVVTSLTCRILTFLTLWKLCSPRSLFASLWVFVKWAVCAISAVLLDSLKLLIPAVCMSLFNDCPSVHCSARLLSFTQRGHLSDQVADMFSFLFLFISPLFRSLFLASYWKGTYFCFTFLSGTLKLPSFDVFLSLSIFHLPHTHTVHKPL